MENDLVKDLIRESLFAKWAAMFSVVVSIFNMLAFFWFFHLWNVL